MLFLYRSLTNLIYPILIIIIYIRIFLKKEDKLRFKEKIFSSSFKPKREDKKKLIWFHAASLGETQSIFPVIQSLSKRKDLEFLITTVTISAGNLIKQKQDQLPNTIHRYFPLDVNFLVKIFIKEWNPHAVIFVDSEIWPNFLMEIKRKNIPSIIINGRITPKTFKRWSLVSNFAKEIFSIFTLCLASSNESKEYFSKLNVKNLKYLGNIKLASNIKFEFIKNENEVLINKKNYWCAASTHKGEEEFCLRTHLILKKKCNNLLTIIIPRHVDRSKKIFELCLQLNLKTQILNEKDLIKEDKEVVIINHFGTLQKYFKYAKSVFIGKSLLKELQFKGGQNPIEAAKLGCKIYHGPYVYNFREVYELLSEYKISNQISNETQLAENLLNDLKETKKDDNKITEQINSLGKKVLNESIKEIENILDV